MNGAYSRNCLPKINKGTNFNKSWWVEINRNSLHALYLNGNNESPSYDVINFNSVVVEHISKNNRKFIGHKNIITTIYSI